jgi:hypothetical protein
MKGQPFMVTIGGDFKAAGLGSPPGPAPTR